MSNYLLLSDLLMNFTRKITIAFFATSILLVSCEKTKNPETSVVDSDVATATDNSLMDATFNDVQNISDQAASGELVSFLSVNGGEGGKDISFQKTSCATITHDTLSSPRLLTIDFGTTNCLCNDGRNRRGQISVSYTGSYRDAGSSHTISFNEYFVNNHKVLGSKTVLNNGLNSDNNLSFTITIDGKVVKANSSDTISLVSDRVRVWTEGSSTISWTDDVYSITGTASGVNSVGVSYTAAITSPLIIDLSCRWIKSGVLDITPQGKLTRTVDYGSGSCDADATVSIAGVSFPIVLP